MCLGVLRFWCLYCFSEIKLMLILVNLCAFVLQFWLVMVYILAGNFLIKDDIFLFFSVWESWAYAFCKSFQFNIVVWRAIPSWLFNGLPWGYSDNGYYVELCSVLFQECPYLCHRRDLKFLAQGGFLRGTEFKKIYEA